MKKFLSFIIIINCLININGQHCLDISFDFESSILLSVDDSTIYLQNTKLVDRKVILLQNLWGKWIETDTLIITQNRKLPLNISNFPYHTKWNLQDFKSKKSILQFEFINVPLFEIINNVLVLDKINIIKIYSQDGEEIISFTGNSLNLEKLKLSKNEIYYINIGINKYSIILKKKTGFEII